MKKSKETSTTEGQTLLKQLLDEEINKMRIKAYPWQRSPFLNDEITIEEADLSELHAIGLYRSEEIKELKYIHHIYIGTGLLTSYKNEKDKWWKKIIEDRIRTTIKHEICHAFTKEKLSWISDIKGIDYDSSPIFCAVLYFFDAPSNHEYFSFVTTELGKKVRECKKERCDNNFKAFDHLLSILISYIVEFNNVTRKLEVQTTITKDTNNVPIKQIEYRNNFLYSDKSYGLLGSMKMENENISLISANNKKNFFQLHLNDYFWEIGCNVSPQNLEEILNKKKGADITNFKTKEQSKTYMVNAKTIKQLTYYDEITEQLRAKRAAKTGGGSGV